MNTYKIRAFLSKKCIAIYSSHARFTSAIPFVIPNANQELLSTAIAILVPHPDDEVIGCFHLISTLGKDIPIDLYYITGNPISQSSEGIDNLALRRRKESESATSNLPIRKKTYWNFTDGDLSNNQNELKSRLLTLEENDVYTHVLSPSITDLTPDHFELAKAALSTINKTRIVWYRSTYLTFPIFSADFIASGNAKEKLQSLLCFKSQKNLALSNVVNASKVEAYSYGIRATSLEAFRFASSGPLKWSPINVLAISVILKLRKWHANSSN